MRVTDAIKSTAELTGNVVSEATLCRWLSELDGQLMFDFYKGDAFIGYTWDTDENAELLVPFPWDGMYINYLEAMVYYSNGEYDRYQNAITQYNKKIDDYRKWLTRKAVPINPALLQGRPIGGTPTTVNFVGKNDTPWYFLSAYALAVKHGYAGTETEWLEAIKGLSAYEVALENGYAGTEEEWLASLVGPPGGVNSFNGRKGDVKPQKGDYSYDDVGAAAAKHAAQHAKDGADPLTLAMLGLAASAQQIDDAVVSGLGNFGWADDRYATILAVCNAMPSQGGSFFVVTGMSLYNADDAAFKGGETQYFVLTDDAAATRKTVIAWNYGTRRLKVRQIYAGAWFGGDWTEYATTGYAVPLDGSKAMTGDLTISKGTLAGVFANQRKQYDGTTISSRFFSSDAKTASIGLYDVDNSAYLAQFRVGPDKLQCYFGDSSALKTVLHTGNKPSGSYTGNGSAVERKISTGGMGGVFIIYSGNGIAIVTPNGTISCPTGGAATFSTEAYGTYPTDGSFIIASTSDVFNKNGAGYTYIVL